MLGFVDFIQKSYSSYLLRVVLRALDLSEWTWRLSGLLKHTVKATSPGKRFMAKHVW